MNILSLDLSLNSTGWATWNGALTYGIIPGYTSKTPGAYEDVRRISHDASHITSRVTDGTLVVMEDFSFLSNNPGARENAGLAYLLRYWLYQHRVPYVLVSPKELKKFVTGTGNAKKELVLKEMYKRFDLDLSDNNEADACGLCFIGRTLTGSYTPTTDFQRDVVSKLNKKFTEVLKQAA